MYFASSEARNSTACAASQAVPIRPIRQRALRLAISAAASPPATVFERRSPTRGECIRPGITVLQRMPPAHVGSGGRADELDHRRLARAIGDMVAAAVTVVLQTRDGGETDNAPLPGSVITGSTCL